MSEYALNVGVSLQHVLHDCHAFRTVEVSCLAGYNIKFFVSYRMEALASVDGSAGTVNAFKLSSLCLLTCQLYKILGCHLGTGYVVGSDGAVNINAIDYTVYCNDFDSLINCILYSGGDCVRVDGVNDQNRDVLRDQIFNIACLLCGIIAGVYNDQLYAQLFCLGFSAIGQSNEEGVVQCGYGKADAAGTGCCCSFRSCFCCGLLTVYGNGAAAGCHGKCHHACHYKCCEFSQFHNFSSLITVEKTPVIL